jgi:hypothetical protein
MRHPLCHASVTFTQMGRSKFIRHPLCHASVTSPPVGEKNPDTQITIQSGTENPAPSTQHRVPRTEYPGSKKKALIPLRHRALAPYFTPLFVIMASSFSSLDCRDWSCFSWFSIVTACTPIIFCCSWIAL